MTGLPRCQHDAVRRAARTVLIGVLVLLVLPPAPAGATGPPPGSTLPAFAAPVWQPVALPVRTDSVRDEQWQLKELRADQAWRESTGKGITVAVLDSGVDGSHPDLAGQVLPGIDLVARPDDTRAEPTAGAGQHDPVGHGTTIAALIAGRNDDTRGVVGLAPDAKILPVRVLDDENRYDNALIVAQGVRWAVDHGAQVINLSLGGSGDSPELQAAIDYAFSRDVVVVACTGNVTPSAPTKVWYPAREPGVLAVAGLDRTGDKLWSGSISGSETVLSAPATGLLGARPGGFWRVQGTSFAAPLVAATAALVRARWPAMSAGDVVNQLTGTARDLGPPGRDDRFGFGAVDPVAAVTRSLPGVGRNPLDDDKELGSVGFGRAPGLDTADTAGTNGYAPSGGRVGGGHASGPGGNWAAQPAGATTGEGSGLLGGVAVFMVVVVGALVLAWRLGHLPIGRAGRRNTD